MKTYHVFVTQENKMTLQGVVPVQASSEEEALKLVKEMSQQELEDKSTDWEQGEKSNFEGCSDINVYDEFVDYGIEEENEEDEDSY